MTIWPGYFAVSKFGNGRMRFTSFIEFIEPSLELQKVPKTEFCMDKLKECATQILDPEEGDELSESIKNAKVNCGERPWSPDDIPTISTTRYKNLYVNTGHGHWGWRMGCGSGLLMADIITGQSRCPEYLEPYLKLDRHCMLKVLLSMRVHYINSINRLEKIFFVLR